jgi:hypothetical protein
MYLSDTAVPGQIVLCPRNEHGIGVTPGMSVARFRSEPMNEAILRASSERNSPPRFGSGGSPLLGSIAVKVSVVLA